MNRVNKAERTVDWLGFSRPALLFFFLTTSPFLFADFTSDKWEWMAPLPELDLQPGSTARVVLTLEILDKETVSLILMDLQMPVMDGFTCTDEIRKRDDDKKQIPIIAVTANLMDADKERCIKSGMNDFLKKPVKLDILRDSLSKYVE